MEPKKYEEIKHQRLEFKKQKDKRQAPLKIVLNSTYGILKDKNNPFYDPRMSNQVCVTGQLLLLDLVEKVEHLGEVLQMNTDGVYMYMKDMESVEKVKQIAHEWERRTMLELEFDIYAKIYQRDVNNYIIVDENGHYKSKGCVKKKSPIDYDLPIITKAIINYCVNDIPIEDTINNCDDLIEFQKIVKVSKLYKYAYYGTVKQITEGKNKFTVRDEGIKLPEKVLRVFASLRDDDKGVFKVKNEKKVEKIANTPDKCFIFNEDVKYEKCPDYLDRSYYIELAKEQLNDFLGLNDKVIKIKKSNEEQILEVLNKNYTDFYDVLVDIKLNTNITNAILLKYINIEAFNRFGKCKKLSKYLNLFKMIYGKKSVTPKMIKDINNDEILDILKSNCDYDSIKNTYKNLNSEQALRDIFKYLPDEDIHISTKIKQEYDLYDDLTIKDSSLDENLIFIMNINNTKNPSIIAYNLKYGVVNILKINKEIFNILELRVGDFVYIKSMERKPKVKVIDKVDGVNVLGCSEEFYDWWLNEYEIILRDYGKNNKLIVDTEME